MKRTTNLLLVSTILVFGTACNTSGTNYAKTFWGTTSYVEKKSADGSSEKYVGVNKDTINRIAEQTATNANDMAAMFFQGYMAGRSGALPIPPATSNVVVPALPGEVAKVR